jgi:ribosomal protein S18 acetylase RimI-like enzyme
MIILDNIDTSYCKAIVEIHKNAFKGFFLTNLGDDFLKTYYKAVLKSNETIAVCAIDESKTMAGFAVGTILSKGFHKRLILQNCFSFGLTFIKIALRSPSSIMRLVKNLEKKSSLEDDGNYAELLSIGISDNFQSQGIGQLLITAFEKRVKEKNGQKLTLTTDKYENDKTINFYTKSEYSLLYEFTSYPHRPMYKFIKQL